MQTTAQKEPAADNITETASRWSPINILMMECICLEALVFAGIFIGAPPALYVVVLIAGTINHRSVKIRS